MAEAYGAGAGRGAAPAPLRGQQRLPRPARGRPGWCSAAPRRTPSWSSSSSCRATSTRTSSPPRRTRSSSRGRPGRTRCSPAWSRRRWTGSWPAAAAGRRRPCELIVATGLERASSRHAGDSAWPVGLADDTRRPGRDRSAYVRDQVPDAATARRSPRRVSSKHPGAVGVIALDDHDRVALVSAVPAPGRHRLIELPAGLLDVEGEDYLAAGQRELAEEVGLRGRTLGTCWSICSPRRGSSASRCGSISPATWSPSILRTVHARGRGGRHGHACGCRWTTWSRRSSMAGCTTRLLSGGAGRLDCARARSRSGLSSRDGLSPIWPCAVEVRG